MFWAAFVLDVVAAPLSPFLLLLLQLVPLPLRRRLRLRRRPPLLLLLLLLALLVVIVLQLLPLLVSSVLEALRVLPVLLLLLLLYYYNNYDGDCRFYCCSGFPGRLAGIDFRNAQEVLIPKPQRCKKPYEAQRVPLHTSQLRRAISDLKEELSILQKRSATRIETLRTRPEPMLNCKSTLFAFTPSLPSLLPPPPPPVYSSTRSFKHKMTQSAANRILHRGAALPCGHKPPRGLLFDPHVSHGSGFHFGTSHWQSTTTPRKPTRRRPVKVHHSITSVHLAQTMA